MNVDGAEYEHCLASDFEMGSFIAHEAQRFINATKNGELVIIVNETNVGREIDVIEQWDTFCRIIWTKWVLIGMYKSGVF